ncbi:MAG: DUF2726 domain-containing protein [Pseudomonadota bacterium]|nr:DUF2726 domain-containing protein [Pseudomonadota bacterium]
MSNMLTPLIPIVLIMAFLFILKELVGTLKPALRVEAKPLMTVIERETICHIEQAVPYSRVHAQVCMGAIIKPKRGQARRQHLATRNRFSQKMIDYVLEDRASGRIIALVELDDRSHDADRDARRDEITRAAGYLTIRIPASRRPDAISVRQTILQALSTHTQPRSPSAAPTRVTRHRKARMTS